MLTVREKQQRNENMRFGPEDNFEHCSEKKKISDQSILTRGPEITNVFCKFIYNFCFQSSSSAVGTVSCKQWQVAQDSSVLRNEEEGSKGVWDACLTRKAVCTSRESSTFSETRDAHNFQGSLMNLIHHIWFYCNEIINMRNFLSETEELIKLLVTKSKFIMALDTAIKNVGIQNNKSNSDLKLPSRGKKSISRKEKQN